MVKISSGIYKISTTFDSRIYIGSSKNIESRIVTHKGDLKRNKHCNFHLQAFVNKYGLERLIFEILEECLVEKLQQQEQFYIDSLNSTFNIAKKAGIPFVINKTITEHKRSCAIEQWKNRTPEQKQLIIEKTKHTISLKSEEAKMQMRENSKSLGMLGKKQSEQQKLKVSIALKGRKIGGALKTEQVSLKIKQIWDDPTSKYNSEEYQAACKRRLNTPEVNKKKGKAWITRKNKKLAIILQCLIIQKTK